MTTLPSPLIWPNCALCSTETFPRTEIKRNPGAPPRPARPSATNDTQPSLTPKAMKSMNDKPNRRVLIVDDNHAIHDDFRKILGEGRKGADRLDEAEAALFGGPLN